MSDSQIGSGLSYPNSLGVSFSQTQISGGAGGGVPPETVSTVTLTQSGNSIFAEPGTSSVDIGQTTTGLNVANITNIAGTTYIADGAIFNGNVVIPHQYQFSHNPENNVDVPNHIVNANVLFGGNNFLVDNTYTSISSIIDLTGTIAVEGPTTITGRTNVIGYTTVEGDTGITGNFNAFASNSVSLTAPGANITLNSNLTLTGNSKTYLNTSNFYIHTSNQSSNYAGRQYLIADGGYNPAYEGYVDITSQGGYQGRINMDAYAGLYGTTLGGQVTINAWGGNNPLLNYGGLITLNAYSGPLGEYGGLTSAIRLNAASIGLSAGSLFAPANLAGSLGLYGQGLVSIVSALAPPRLPQTTETVYLYGFLGVNLESPAGIQLKDDTYIKAIYPLSGAGDLLIAGRTLPTAKVVIQDVKSLTMTAGNGVITNLSTINNLYTFSPTGDLGGISSINGVPYPYPDPSSINVSSWSKYPQLYTLSTFVASTITASNNLTVNDTATITNANITNLTGGSGPVPAISVNSEFEMNFHSIRGVASLYVGAYIYNDAQIWTPSLRGGRGINGPTDFNLNIEPGLDAYIQPNRDLILRPSGVLEIQNLSSINGVAYPSAVNGFVSTATSALDMSLFDIVSTQRITANNATLVGTLTTANVNASGNVNVSSINNAVYPPPGQGWVGTATSALNMNGNSIYGATTVSASGQISANNFITASVAVNTGNITIGGTTLDSGGLSASGVTLGYANVSGNVQAGSLTNVVSINSTKTFAQPVTNLYYNAGVTGAYYDAQSPGIYNVQSATATAGGDLSFQLDVRDANALSGQYRVCNANAHNNMYVQFTTIGTDGTYHNWAYNNQLNPGESVRASLWYNNYQGRYVFTDFLKEGNPSPTN